MHDDYEGYDAASYGDALTPVSVLAPEDPDQLVEPTFDELKEFIEENRPEEPEQWFPAPNRAYIRRFKHRVGLTKLSRSRLKRRTRKQRTGGVK